MIYYIIKDGLTVNSCLWDGITPWVYPFEHDSIIPEAEWNIEQYPYPDESILELNNNMNSEAILTPPDPVQGFINDLQALYNEDGNLTKDDLISFLNDYSFGEPGIKLNESL